LSANEPAGKLFTLPTIIQSTVINMSPAVLNGDLAKLSLRLAKRKVPTWIPISILAISKTALPEFTSIFGISVRLMYIILRQIVT
jgi:hypothetical protein